ncbi:putative SurA domain-containing protein [uncultured delta proteobacterium]|uniref:Putative SurA domain-containing protein n=1 Tax=uncultured delta proteobacterium TaxID=34034 RepID=A0A212J1I9_9DELT|nr:putative SurA domain-containing protein [uncultured delta proteobacterium]
MSVVRQLSRFSFSPFFVLTACLFALALAGCTDNIWRGQVATVNGRPITLDQVAALRNSTHFDWTSPSMAEMDVMRKQYGDALTNLVAVELVKQHLDKKKLAVSREELLAEENHIRSDYPPGTFEEVLVNEAIDLDTWRFLLHNHLSVLRFLDKVLRPDIVITPEEVDAYLKAHPKEFVRPPWAYFFLVSGIKKEDVTACAKDLDADGDPVVVQERHPDATIRTVRLDTNRLDPVLGQVVARLRPGDLSPLFAMGGEFHQVLLLETLPERQAEPDEAYLQIEETLVAQKVQEAYNKWVQGRMQKATIKISEQLLPRLRGTVEPQDAAVPGPAPNDPS